MGEQVAAKWGESAQKKIIEKIIKILFFKLNYQSYFSTRTWILNTNNVNIDIIYIYIYKNRF